MGVRAGSVRTLALGALGALLIVAGPATLRAQAVYNIHLHTDSTPDWTTRESFLETGLSPWTEPQDQAIAIWRWMTRSHRQTHQTREDGRSLWDPIHFYNSYANTFCGFMAAFVTTFADGLGGDWRHRYVELGDHTVAEVSWDGGASWHMLDTSMVTFAYDHDGSIASCDDIRATGSCEVSDFFGAPAEPGHLYLYHTEQACMTNPPDPAQAADLGYPSGYRKAVDDPVAYSRTLRNGADSFTDGFVVQDDFTHVRHGWSYKLHLKPGQTYTRRWTRLGDTESYYRPTSRGEDPDATDIAGGFHGNGFWETTVDLGSTAYRPSIHDEAGLLHLDEGAPAGPMLQVDGAGAGELVLKVDAANVVTSGAITLSGRRPAGDVVAVSVSRDAGMTWTQVWTADADPFAAEIALGPDLVGGAHEYLVRIDLTENGDAARCGLDALASTTVTQVNRFTLPRLALGPNRVRFALGAQEESLTLWPPLHDDGDGGQYQESAESWHDVVANDDHDEVWKATLRPTYADAESHVTWRFRTPSDITSVHYGGSLHARLSGASDYVHLRHALDEGGFVTDATFDSDSTPWFDGRVYADVVPPAGRRDVSLRYVMSSSVDADWSSTGVQDVMMTVVHEPRHPGFAPVAVTFNWTEHHAAGDVVREHVRVIASDEDVWALDVGGYRDPTMNWVRTALADPGDATGDVIGESPAPAAARDLVRPRFDWHRNLAFGRPYTLSRAGAALNGDGGGELTNGVIVPPTTWMGAGDMQDQTAFWDGDDPLTVTVDLGSERDVGAVRVTTHQPDAQYGHAGTIEIETSVDGSVYHPLGVIQHDDVWRPFGGDMHWGFVQSPDFADLPAGGHLAHSFWLIVDEAASGRWLRLRFTPLAGHGLGVSEIQAFSDVVLEDWPDREIVIEGPVSVEDPGGDEGDGDDENATPAADAMSVAPNPGNPGMVVGYSTVRPGAVRLSVVDLRGRTVRVLADGWRGAGEHRAVWDGRDAAGRPAASGSYVSVLETASSTTSTRLVLVR